MAIRFWKIGDEVKRQIESMQALDEDGEPNFNDADYQLAAYAAALKVLTQYATLDGRDVEHEVFAVRGRNEKSDFETVIGRALGIACDTLIPVGLENSWRELSLVERYYLRALDIESRGERRKGMYEELARGFGVTDIKPLLSQAAQDYFEATDDSLLISDFNFAFASPKGTRERWYRGILADQQGGGFRAAGAYDSAATAYMEALDIYVSSGDKRREAIVLGSMLIGVLLAGIVIVTATATIGWLAGKMIDSVAQARPMDEKDPCASEEC